MNIDRRVIALSGTGGVGKSTLLEALRKDSFFDNFTFINETTRTLHELGHKINEDGNDETQLKIAELHMLNIKKEGDLFLDRSLLDCYVYSLYMQRNGQITVNTMMEIAAMWKAYKESVTMHLYIPIEFDNVNDGVRSTNDAFRSGVDELFKQSFLDLIAEGNSNIGALTGTVEDRVSQVKELLINQED